MTIEAELLSRLLAAAERKGLLAGDRDALRGRLSAMAGDLLPEGLDFSQGEAEMPPAEADWSDVVRGLGEGYWRQGLAEKVGKAKAVKANSRRGRDQEILAYQPQARGREVKKLLGSFYTPDWVIDQVLDPILPEINFATGLKGTVCDPALGCGFFPLRLLDRLLQSHPRETVAAWAAENLYGIDVDAGAVFMARALLWLRLAERDGDFQQLPGRFIHGDSLLGPAFAEQEQGRLFMPASGGRGAAVTWRSAFPAPAKAGGFSVILGNPPYEVLTNFQKYPERQLLADKLRRCGFYRDSVRGQINLYRCFIERGLALLPPGGRLSLVVPLSLARDGGAAGLRRRLLEAEAAAEWKLFGEEEALFKGVTQAVCIFAATKGGGKAEEIGLESGGKRRRVWLRDLGEGRALPLFADGGEELWRWLRENCQGRFGDVAEMRVGEVDQTVYRECMKDEDTGCLLARGEHLQPFVLTLGAGTDGGAGKWRYLDLPRFLAMKGKGGEACRERAKRERVVQLGIRNMQTRPRLVAARVGPGVYLGNSLNVYTPKPGIDLGFLAGVLNSRLLDWLFCLESGNNNINLYEMAALPFPWPCQAGLVSEVSEAYRDCEKAALRKEKLTPWRCRLDRAVQACYGVPERGGIPADY